MATDREIDMRRALWAVARYGTLAFFVLLFLHMKVSVKVQRDYRPYIFDATYDLPGPEVLRAVALNHRTAAADLMWVDAVQFVARATVQHRTADDVTYYAESITDLDPYFHKVYSWHSASRMLIAGYPSPEDVEASNDLLEKGLTYFPEDWRLAQEAAANYIGFTRGVDEETRVEQLERGLEFAQRAAEIEGSPDSTVLLAASFQDKLQRYRGGDTAAARSIDTETLTQLYLTADSERVRQSILNRLRRHARSEEFVDRLRSYESSFSTTYNASSLSYLPRNLFMSVSPLVQSGGEAEDVAAE
jgi:hypothetical protein